MNVDILCDNHVHTSLCRHASGTMEAYVTAAIDKGLQQLVFLEHLEEGIVYPSRTWLTEADFDAYFEEGERLRTVYDGRIKIGLGVEVGYNPACSEIILERLARRPWDCIGLSYHFAEIPGQSGHVNLLSRKKINLERIGSFGGTELLSHYFDTLIEAVRVIPAQILCHLDAGLRYYPGLSYDETHRNQIEQLLLSIKSSGMLLEINTSGYGSRGKPFPSQDILARAKELDIGMTAGSDAHQPSEVGRFFERIAEL